MAPERKNTHKVSLDSINGMLSVFGAVTHVYEVLRFKEAKLDMRRLRLAFAHYNVTFDEMSMIETAWERWQDHFMGDNGKCTDFFLPSHLIPKPRGRPVIDDNF